MIGAERCGAGGQRLHCWLVPPLQVQISTSTPLAVPAPVTSRQSPDCTPTIVPVGLTVQRWLAAPVQSEMSTAVPAAVPWLRTFRHFVPYTPSAPLASWV